jgi:hypothetical protein
MAAWGAMLELKIPYLGDNLWQLGYVQVTNFRPRPLPYRLPGKDPIEPEVPTGQDLGQFVQANTLFELKDIGGSGLDVFAAYTLTYLQPGAARMVYKIPLDKPLNVVHPVTQQVASQFPGPLTVETGLASYDSGDVFSMGHMFYVGFRFSLKAFSAYTPRFGFELNHGSKYHVPFASPSAAWPQRAGPGRPIISSSSFRKCSLCASGSSSSCANTPASTSDRQTQSPRTFRTLTCSSTPPGKPVASLLYR